MFIKFPLCTDTYCMRTALLEASQRSVNILLICSWGASTNINRVKGWVSNRIELLIDRWEERGTGRWERSKQTEMGKRKKRRQEKNKRPRSGVRSSVVRGTLLSEPVAVVSGTASVHVIRQRASGSSPSHFVPPLTASRPDCLTDCWWERDGERKRGHLPPPFIVSEEEISNVKQLKLLRNTS